VAFYLNPVSIFFAEDIRHQMYGCIMILQVLDNATASVKKMLPRRGFDVFEIRPLEDVLLSPNFCVGLKL